ncbi:MAG: hypothetical protein WDM77_16735 [Steroidobacteraceae bacterium]
MPLQNGAVDLGATAGAILTHAFHPDAVGRPGVEDIDQGEGEQRDDHGKEQQAEACGQSHQGHDNQPHGVARRIRRRAEADETADAEHHHTDHGAEFAHGHADHRAITAYIT